jgi:hypothetical protein
MTKRSIAAAASAFTLVSCAPHMAEDSKPPSRLSAPVVMYGTQVVTGNCIGEAEAAGLPAMILGSVIAQGVNRIGAALTAAAAEETKVVTARRNIEVRKSDTGLGECIMIARGWFYRDSPFGDTNRDGTRRDPSPYFGNSESAFPYKAPNDLWNAGLYIAATPDFFFQGRIGMSTDKSSYTVLPIEATLDRPISTTELRPTNKRRVLVSFAFSEVGKGADLSKAGTGTTLILGAMRPGVLMTFPKEACVVYYVDGGRRAAPTCPREDSFDLLMRSTFESEWFNVPLTQKSKPMLLQAAVSETRDASAFLGFVAAVFGDVKGKVTSELQEALISSSREAAEDVELSAEEKAENEFDTAYSKAVTDLKGCVAAPTDASKRTGARAALRGLIGAARKADKAGFAITTEDVDRIKVNGTTDDACQAALNKLATVG